MSNVKTESSAEFLMELAEKQGVVCSSVKDGHVLIFMKTQLQAFLAEIEAKQTDRVVVFVKRADPSN